MGGEALMLLRLFWFARHGRALIGESLEIVRQW